MPFSALSPIPGWLSMTRLARWWGFTSSIPTMWGRCSHIGNTSYAVKEGLRGLHIGEKLVKDSLQKGAQFGFRLLQFNAVVASNIHALHLYERLGFTQLGRIPQGFLMKDGHYEDIILFYIKLIEES